MTIDKFFKKHIIEIKPYLSEFIKQYGPHLLREFWLSDELIRLMTNENLFGPSPRVIEAIKDYAKNVYRYPEPTCIELREKLAEYNKVEPNNIYLAPGSLAALDAIFRGFLNPEDNIVLSLPTYDPYLLRLQVVGSKPKLIQMKEPNFERDIDKMLKAIDEKTKIVILMNPHNPVGIDLPLADVEPFFGKRCDRCHR
ncbi:MAG: aminotransferase class I/II-fold pyridoxal phosphate-dependent enzyme [Candidatus Njordarchaeia archaeon]